MLLLSIEDFDFVSVEDVERSSSNENLINILFARIESQNLQIERLQRDEVLAHETSDDLHRRLVEEEHRRTDLVLRLQAAEASIVNMTERLIFELK